jgi:hypothetical protein
MPCEKPLRTVQLRHDLPDGSCHIDWMIARDPAGSLPLSAWRLARCLHDVKPGESAPLERLPDHRPLYLDYEGPVSGNRGSVRREAAGTVRRNTNKIFSPEETGEIEVHWQIAGTILTQRLSLVRLNEENWIVTRVE